MERETAAAVVEHLNQWRVEAAVISCGQFATAPNRTVR